MLSSIFCVGASGERSGGGELGAGARCCGLRSGVCRGSTGGFSSPGAGVARCDGAAFPRTPVGVGGCTSGGSESGAP